MPFSIKLYGFYPKFDNDDRNDEIDMKKFKDLENIEYFFKFSGFLGQVIPFRYNNMVYWTATSKNSADSESIFLQDSKRIFSKTLNEINLTKLVNDG